MRLDCGTRGAVVGILGGVRLSVVRDGSGGQDRKDWIFCWHDCLTAFWKRF